VKVVKNKCAAPFKQCEVDIIYGKGISREGSVVDLGVELGIVKKSGAWFTCPDVKEEIARRGHGAVPVPDHLPEGVQLGWSGSAEQSVPGHRSHTDDAGEPAVGNPEADRSLQR
jgi:hypothetical protein